MYNVTQYSPPRSLPIRPTHPASRVIRSGLPTSGADKSIREEGRANYIYTRSINGCSATLSKWPHPGIYALGQLTKQASALMRETEHASCIWWTSFLSVIGWLEGERIKDGRRGWFPSDHTMEIENQQVRRRNFWVQLRRRRSLSKYDTKDQRDQSAWQCYLLTNTVFVCFFVPHCV